jgi:hypothetical protein
MSELFYTRLLCFGERSKSTYIYEYNQSLLVFESKVRQI